jgi:hypothetical protein
VSSFAWQLFCLVCLTAPAAVAAADQRLYAIGNAYTYSAVQNDVLYVGLDATAWQAAPNMSTMRYLTSTATVSGELNLLL